MLAKLDRIYAMNMKFGRKVLSIFTMWPSSFRTIILLEYVFSHIHLHAPEIVLSYYLIICMSLILIMLSLSIITSFNCCYKVFVTNETVRFPNIENIFFKNNYSTSEVGHEQFAHHITNVVIWMLESGMRYYTQHLLISAIYCEYRSCCDKG